MWLDVTFEEVAGTAAASRWCGNEDRRLDTTRVEAPHTIASARNRECKRACVVIGNKGLRAHSCTDKAREAQAQAPRILMHNATSQKQYY
eukprot:scaffold64540_cov37-Tisochrysis_lutea.AAC.2